MGASSLCWRSRKKKATALRRTTMQTVNGVDAHYTTAPDSTPIIGKAEDEPIQLPGDFIQRLKAPLPPEAVSPNPDKPGLSSIKVIFVVERLNDVFGLNGWKVVNEVIESGQMVVVKATLTVPKYGSPSNSLAGTTISTGAMRTR